jgi:hypothetical protein
MLAFSLTADLRLAGSPRRLFGNTSHGVLYLLAGLLYIPRRFFALSFSLEPRIPCGSGGSLLDTALGRLQLVLCFVRSAHVCAPPLVPTPVWSSYLPNYPVSLLI